MAFRRMTLVSIVIVLGAGCSSAQKQTDRSVGALGEKQQIAIEGVVPQDVAATRKAVVEPGYLVRMSHSHAKDLTGQYRIAFDGNLALPYDVTINTRDMDIPSLTDAIRNAYQPYLKDSSKIKVSLEERRLWVDVRGLVSKPGRYLIKSDASVDEVIAKAGGVVAGAGANYIKVSNGESSRVYNLADYFRTGDISQSPSWKGGDLAFFQREPEGVSQNGAGGIRIYGEVRSPGEYGYKEGADLFYYLSKAGGPTALADIGKTSVVRGPEGQRTILKYDLTDTKDVPHLQSNDLVIFSADRRSPLEKALQQVAYGAAFLTAIAAGIIAF